MIQNRSVPASTMLAHVVYQDVTAAVEWLAAKFGFVEHYRYGEPAMGAQMHFGDAWIMLRQARGGEATPAQIDHATQSLTIFVEDVDAHYAHAKAAGVEIVEEINETPYGERQYGVKDLDGHRWLFACHVKDVSPSAWGAQIA